MPGSEPDRDAFAPVPDLICPPQDIIDGDALWADLQPEFDDAPDAAAVRAATVTRLRSAMKTGREAIANALAEHPRTAYPAIASYAYLTDGIVTLIYRVAVERLHPLANPTASERIALLAVGGYGRGEMAPQSDVDLLFLTPYKITPWAESVIESMLYMLWDLRLKVGHASRTIDDCLRLGEEDFTIRTALLEQRHVCGDADLARQLDDELWNKLFKHTLAEFIEAKLAERDTRHEKQGDQRFMVEPNVKEGKGGLRDLQTLFWVAKYQHRVREPRDLVSKGVFTEDEFDTFRDAEEFLWAVRCQLHLVTNRPADQLTFDLQVEVADRLGFKDTEARRGVEHFMQAYFRHATQVGDLTRIVLSALEAEQLKEAPTLLRLFKRRKRLKPGYREKHGRLDVVSETDFLSDKLNLLRLFEEGLRTGMLIHPDVMRLVSANLDLIDDDMRNNKEANRIFLDLLLKHGNPERALRRMNEVGVLAAFIPEFEPIKAMMQFNMYHSYTVDEHTIQVISNFAQIERRELGDELPISTEILKRGINRKVLMVAMLLHDIGKGQPQDHSILGAQIARRVAPRLGLNAKDSATVEWLVRYHLLMSDMAQKRDIADPRTVRDFAKAVKTMRRLELLTVLTVCDIRGVGPNTWNNWKATLIRTLYNQTQRALEDGMEDLNRATRGAEAKRALRQELSDWSAKDLRAETSRHYDSYWQGLHVTAHKVFANLLRDIKDDEVRIDIYEDEERDVTRVYFALADHPGIFSRIAGALTAVRANIVDARTYTSKDGYATACFWVQDADGHPFDVDRKERIEKMLHRLLKGEVIATEANANSEKLKKRERVFKVPTHITFDNEGSEIYTIIEVDTRDRPGLLHDLTRTLANANIYIASAVIATYGEQVVDSFYVKDMFGLKIMAEHKKLQLEAKLRQAIEQTAERATA
ncbi:bifunctional uridylyltransferase/uridylyl-removing enzyme [Aliiroseovarius zhejiangensis]|uniref:Bifunctional uridylyltransferase/uridylyl-removing enzyme n=1 Tax=Aliiroseovarius zhejiangensis TaxID=1632025 RepID=A0ABQ3J3A9_9RHOB|nr:[protein-PII] uridylyltransferase [Aliiroseovarius zhejiangensis]GHE99887.1 bifunctional uridylyltransferase/uridylyl-removing enzyme [Aliiroseovarius zhejiangensis]